MGSFLSSTSQRFDRRTVGASPRLSSPLRGVNHVVKLRRPTANHVCDMQEEILSCFCGAKVGSGKGWDCQIPGAERSRKCLWEAMEFPLEQLGKIRRLEPSDNTLSNGRETSHMLASPSTSAFGRSLSRNYLEGLGGLRVEGVVSTSARASCHKTP